jgi:hypothetical protein
MQKTDFPILELIATLALLVIAGTVSFLLFPTLNSVVAAAWVQAIGSIATIGMTIAFVYIRRSHVQARDEEKIAMADAATLVALSDMASELALMCNLANYQKQDPNRITIYPDIAAEFEAIAEMLGKMPIERLAVRGKIPHFLRLRRIAIELEMIFRAGKDDGDMFIVKNRDRIGPLMKECYETAKTIESAVEKIAPGKFAAEDRLEKHS